MSNKLFKCVCNLPGGVQQAINDVPDCSFCDDQCKLDYPNAIGYNCVDADPDINDDDGMKIFNRVFLIFFLGVLIIAVLTFLYYFLWFKTIQKGIKIIGSSIKKSTKRPKSKK